jgi:5-methylcytosine-specific restriction protein B
MAAMKKYQWDLATEEGLKRTVNTVMANLRTLKRGWYPSLRNDLDRVHAASATELSDRAFLYALWENDGISATGMGSVKIAPALDDASFRAWFGDAYSQKLPDDPALIEAHLTKLYKETESRLREKCDRVARLKLNRVLCTRFPMHFTTIADVGRLQFLYSAMGGNSRAHPVEAHLAIKRRF